MLDRDTTSGKVPFHLACVSRATAFYWFHAKTSALAFFGLMEIALISFRVAVGATMAVVATLFALSQPVSAGIIIPPAPVPTASGSNSATSTSWTAGGHAGYNWQQGAVVFGFETDLQGTNLNSSTTGGLTPSLPGDFAATKALIDIYGTARGRLGFASGPFLFYGTAGASYGNVDLSSTFNTAGVQTFASASQLRVGWVAGAGFEYMVSPNLSINFAYQYVDLGSLRVTSSGSGVNGFSAISVGQTASVNAQFQTATIGFSWHFAPSGSPASWGGAYAGGQVGGAWGNRTNGNYTSSSTSLFVPPPLVVE